jgi:hypothetical protein
MIHLPILALVLLAALAACATGPAAPTADCREDPSWALCNDAAVLD